jgi:hypothetical protein
MSIRRLFSLGLTLALLAGCATRLPSASFAKPAALNRAMMAYYDAHATEEHGYCLTPYIDGLTHVDVVDNEPDKLVVDVRYFYRDRSKYDRAQNQSAPSHAQSTTHHECTNFAGRQFTFGKTKTGQVEVLDMTGPRRS